MLLPFPPRAGGLRAHLVAPLLMAERPQAAVFACGFGHMLEGQCESVPMGWGLGEGAQGPET